MSFSIDTRILTTCIELAEWPLSSLFLKNNADYPWLILVPRVKDVQEIYHLHPSLQYKLMEEMSQLSSIVGHYFKPDKLNIGALGNIVPQLHVHIIARYKTDKLWPHGIWQAGETTILYTKEQLSSLKQDLQILLTQ